MKWISVLVFLAGASAHSAFPVEVQINLCDSSKDIQKKLKLDAADSDRRSTFLFETESFEIMESHLTIRLRVEDGEGELAVKLGGMTPSQMRNWEAEGASCEYDLHDGDLLSTGTCKQTKDLKSPQVQSLISGKIAVADMLSVDQRKMIAASAAKDELNSVMVLGPLQDRIWKIENSDFEKKLSFEVSKAPTGIEFLEISTRTPKEDAKETLKDLRNFLSEHGVSECSDQTGQRRRKLEELLKRR